MHSKNNPCFWENWKDTTKKDIELVPWIIEKYIDAKGLEPHASRITKKSSKYSRWIKTGSGKRIRTFLILLKLGILPSSI